MLIYVCSPLTTFPDSSSSSSSSFSSPSSSFSSPSSSAWIRMEVKRWTEGEFALKEKTEPRDIKFPFPRFALGRNTLKGFLFQFENIFPGQFRSLGPIMYIKKENEGDEEE